MTTDPPGSDEHAEPRDDERNADPLARLPNLGPRSSRMLARAGIHTLGQLQDLGSVAAYLRVRQIDGKASLNLLWALEGALAGMSWREVARARRTSLLLALDMHRVDTAGHEPRS